MEGVKLNRDGTWTLSQKVFEQLATRIYDLQDALEQAQQNQQDMLEALLKMQTNLRTLYHSLQCQRESRCTCGKQC